MAVLGHESNGRDLLIATLVARFAEIDWPAIDGYCSIVSRDSYIKLGDVHQNLWP
jgi:hypothetical protein